MPEPSMSLEVCTGDEATDPITVISASTVGDTLVVDVSYGGGCTEHFVGVCWTGLFAALDQAQTKVSLSHDAQGDMCLALVMESYAFDISPLKAAYQVEYDSASGTVQILLPGGTTVDYSF